jgi:hypothetical protein
MSMVLSNAVTTTSSCPELRSSQELLVDRDNKSKFGNNFEDQVDVYDDSMFSQPSSSCPSLVTDGSEISSSLSRPGTPGARMLNEEREELVDIFAEDLELENLISSAILEQHQRSLRHKLQGSCFSPRDIPLSSLLHDVI